MKWTDEAIAKEVMMLIDKIQINRMPTHREMRNNRMTGLSAAISKTGGHEKWAEKLGLETKETEKKWTDELIESELIKCIHTLQLDRMPVSTEIRALKREDLHNAISRSELKYSGWARKLNLELKDSETTKGLDCELTIKNAIETMFKYMTVTKMSTKHPYDLLINGCVKVDVKVAAPHHHFGPRAHTFALNKKYATCDIYVCVALNEKGEIENHFIIPAAHLQIVTLNICRDSKYNQYMNKWNFLDRFVKNYERSINHGLL